MVRLLLALSALSSVFAVSLHEAAMPAAGSHHGEIAKKLTSEVGKVNNVSSELDARGVRHKVGLAWANGCDWNLGQFATSKVHYLYTWSAWCPPEAAQHGLNCAPMLWGWKNVDDFRNARRKPGVNVVMGMNEVNEPSQANMSPQDAFNLWNNEIIWLKKYGQYTFVGPSVTVSPSGLAWMKSFMKLCGSYKCGIDKMAIHYYGTSISDFQNTIKLYWDTFGIPIWVTEYACQNFNGGAQCDNGHLWDFQKQMQAWMDSQDYVHAYFQFGILKNNQLGGVNPADRLMNDNCTPNDLGWYYLYN